MLGHHVTCYVDEFTIIRARNEASQTTSNRLSDEESIRNVLCHEAFDRRWSVYAWPGQVNAWKDLAVSGQCPYQSLHRRMRLKLLPETLVRDELLQRDDLESLGTAKRSTTREIRTPAPKSLLLRCIVSFYGGSGAKMHLEYNRFQRTRFLPDCMRIPAEKQFPRRQPSPKHLASPQASANLLEDV
jgi:hypothetical protein